MTDFRPPLIPESTVTSTSFGDRMRMARAKAGLSQAELSREAMVSLASIQRWEQAHHHKIAEAVMRIARRCGVSVTWLVLGRTD